MRKTELFLLLKNRNLKHRARINRWNHFFSYSVRALLALISIAVVLGILVAGYQYARVAYRLPSVEVLPILLNAENGELLQPSHLLDKNNREILFTYQDEGIQRKYLFVDPQSAAPISPQLLRTVTAALQPDFWSAPGYDLKQWKNPEPVTIAERLVDELLLADEPPSLTRNLRMRLLAGQLVAKFGRIRVLEWYLNSAWFGHYAYGIESAAQLYLGKSASDATLAESALLTPLLESPALNPLDASQTALKNQKAFLRQLLTDGVINQQEYDLALVEKLKTRSPNPAPMVSKPGFVTQVENQLERTFNMQMVLRGGVDVVTTLDSDLQQQFQCATATQLIRVQNSNISGIAPSELDCAAALLLPTQSFINDTIEDLAAGGLIIDPRNGDVLAYQAPLTVTGLPQRDSGYQPGSLLTPFAAVTAFARGYSPASLLWDVPAVNSNLIFADANSTGIYHGAVNIRDSIANDYLVALVSLIENVGPANVWRTANAAGFASLKDSGYDLSPITSGKDTDLTQVGAAFSTFANQGVRTGWFDPVTSNINPNTILRIISSSGRVLMEKEKPDESVILSQPLAYLVNHILSDESARWPSLGYPNVLEIGSSVAAKTGMAAGGHQIWTVGYTPQRLVVVWMGDGLENDQTTELDTRMAAGIWHALIRYATREQKFSGWEIPPGVAEVRVCSPSGMLPSEDCPNIVTDVFLLGNEPTIPDTLYTRIKINRETGQRATVFTQPDLVEERIFMDVPADAREWADRTGLPLAPQGYDSIQQVQIDPDVAITDPSLFTAVSGKVKIHGTAAGEKFAAYTLQVGDGINPDSWLQINESSKKPVRDGMLAEWDTSGLNGLFAIRLSVIDANNLIKTAITQVTVDNSPPELKITYPQDGQIVEPLRGGVTLTATVQDLVGINRVEWWVDGKLEATQTVTPYVYQLLSRSGKHKVVLKAWDTAGNQSQSPMVSFEIKP